jgi:F-type H+-transporting ATPase subunit b
MDETLTAEPETSSVDMRPVEMPGAFGLAPAEGAELIEMTGVADEAHDEETLLGLEAETWVYVSVSIFFVLAIVLGKVPARIAGALDERIAGVRRQLDEAKGLRAEAEALLSDARERSDAAAKEAAAMVARAESEAAELLKASEAAAAETIARRTAAAEAKISAAERSAEAELRAQMAQQVTAAAAALIASKADKAMHDRLTEEAIAGLERRLH